MFRNFEGCEGSSFTIYFGSCLQNGYMHLCTNYSNLTILLAFCDVILAKFPPPPSFSFWSLRYSDKTFVPSISQGWECSWLPSVYSLEKCIYLCVAIYHTMTTTRSFTHSCTIPRWGLEMYHNMWLHSLIVMLWCNG